MINTKWILAALNIGKNKSIHFFVENSDQHSCNLEDAKKFDNEESINDFKKENTWAEFYNPYKILGG